MNTHPRKPPLLLVATLCLLAATASSQPAANPPQPDSRQPATDLVEAKLAEEGDGDVERALAGYRELIQRYEAQREPAAEALFRIGALAHQRGQTQEALAVRERLVREFSDLPRWVEQSAAWQPAPAPDSPPVSANYRMSQELMRRYGLLPADSDEPRASNPETAPQPPATAMDPALRQRYGLGPANPGTETPSTGTMPPELMRRYGLTPRPAAAPAALPASPNLPTASAAATVGALPPSEPPPSTKVRDIQASLTQIRAEMLQLHSQLRRVGRERRLLEIERLDHTPFSLIENPALRQMFDRVETAETNYLRARGRDGEAEAEARAQYETEKETLHSYLKDRYIPRLKTAEASLEREIEVLRLQATATEEELHRVLKAGRAPEY